MGENNSSVLLIFFFTFLKDIISSSAYSHSFSIRHNIVAPASIAYRSCVEAWRSENLGLFLVPPPIVWNRGDEETGQGLVLIRIPPVGLQEGIVDVKLHQWIRYQVLNPGWWTWPVQEHQGTIVFQEQAATDESPEPFSRGCVMEWKVEFTPLSVLFANELWGEFLQWVMRQIVAVAARHVVTQAESNAALQSQEIDTTVE